ncbi:MAG TPA: DUF2520 domain-containing protein [Candidatus Limnocylindrales bacterium]|jgi:predicted short-subunit dehydrogenase-like oxidoreductase (DUF2520 family)
MRPWREEEDAVDEGSTADAVRESGIDLDPVPPGGRRVPGDGHEHGLEHGHGHDPAHAEGAGSHDHPHPHRRSEPGEAPLVGIIGAGAVGTALGVALSRAGWPVAAVATRDRDRRDRFGSLVPGARRFAEASALLDEVELVLVCVPDDAIADVAASIRLYSGQAIVHTSGLLGADVLSPALAAGTQAGSFHPLVAFAETERAVAALHGATVAIEGDDQLAGLLAEMAEAVGATPVRLAPGTKPAYHAAAVLAAGGFVALLDAIAELGRVAGLDEAGSLAIYGPLIEQTLANARSLGIRAALTGPVTRGDRGTLEAHLAALHAHAPDVLALYRAAAEREIELAEARGVLTTTDAVSLRALLATPV